MEDSKFKLSLHDLTKRRLIRDHFVNVPSQWETTLQCNVVSHWMGAFTKFTQLIRRRNIHSCDSLRYDINVWKYYSSYRKKRDNFQDAFFFIHIAIYWNLYLLLISICALAQGSDFKSKGDKLSSPDVIRIRTWMSRQPTLQHTDGELVVFTVV